ncbi:MAG: hypothetical protein RLZZ292_1477 [Bacteroidota bacterium]|jgi:hypothetical protein
MKQLTALFCFLLSLNALTAQRITGKITDKDTKEPLIGATIQVVNSNPIIGVATDVDGKFVLTNLAPGRHAVQCSYVGYAGFQSEQFILTSVKDYNLEVEMSQNLGDLKEVVITASQNTNAPINDAILLGGRSISVEETERIAASINDPARMALSYPSVASNSNDVFNEIIIRGNGPNGILWRLEGMDILNPNHYGKIGTSGGGVTMFSAQLLSRSDFMTGTMPAEYSNATSGAFDVHLRKGNMEKWERRFRFTVLGTDLAIEGPIKKGRSSILINYRYSTLAMLNKIGFYLAGPRVLTGFQDLCFNFASVSKDNKTTWTLFGLRGLSESNYYPEKAENRKYGIADHWADEHYYYNMGTIGTTLTHNLDSKSVLKAVVAYGQAYDGNLQDTLNLKDERYNFSTQNYYEKRVSGALTYNRKLAAATRLKTGVIYRHSFFDLNRQINPRSSAGSVYVVYRPTSLLVKGKEGTGLAQAFAQVSHSFSPQLEANVGLHYMRLLLNGSASLEPRLSMRYKITPASAVSFSAGRQSQTVPLPSYFVQSANGLQPNRDLALITSDQVSIGYNFVTKNQIKLSLEAYYQHLNNIPVQPDTNSLYSHTNALEAFPNFAVVSEGTGTNRGLELSLEKFFSNKFYFILSGSLYKSTYTAFNKKTYNSRYNGRFISSFTIGREYNFTHGTLQIGGRMALNGGYRYSPLDPIASKQLGRYIEQKGTEWTAQSPNYFRLDTRTAYRFNKKKYACQISLDIQNIVNHQNITNARYNPVTNVLENYSEGSSLTPVLGVQFDF